MDDVAARQLSRQLAALFLLWSGSIGGLCIRAWGLRLGRLRGLSLSLCLRCFRFLQSQLELFDGAFDPLRTRTELLTAELGELRLQLLDGQLRDDEAVLGCNQLGVLREQQPLQLGDIVGELIEREQHGPDVTASRNAAAESHGRGSQFIPPASVAMSVAALANPALP